MTATQFRPIFARVAAHFALNKRAWDLCFYTNGGRVIKKVARTYTAIFNSLGPK